MCVVLLLILFLRLCHKQITHLRFSEQISHLHQIFKNNCLNTFNRLHWLSLKIDVNPLISNIPLIVTKNNSRHWWITLINFENWLFCISKLALWLENRCEPSIVAILLHTIFIQFFSECVDYPGNLSMIPPPLFFLTNRRKLGFEVEPIKTYVQMYQTYVLIIAYKTYENLYFIVLTKLKCFEGSRGSG